MEKDLSFNPILPTYWLVIFWSFLLRFVSPDFLTYSTGEAIHPCSLTYCYTRQQRALKVPWDNLVQITLFFQNIHPLRYKPFHPHSSPQVIPEIQIKMR